MSICKLSTSISEFNLIKVSLSLILSELFFCFICLIFSSIYKHHQSKFDRLIL